MKRLPRVSGAMLSGMVFALFALFTLSGRSALAQETPNDAQIAAIVVAANTADINAGKVAESKAHSKDVKSFGKEMVKEHSGSNKQVKALAKKLKLKPEEGDTSKSLADGSRQTIDKLRKLKGAEFDKAYIDNEVSYHQTVLDTIDKTLMPNAKNEDLKALLEKTRPVIAAHLSRAKEIQAAMK